MQNISAELGLLWYWVLRGREGIRHTDGKEAWKQLKRAWTLGLRFVNDEQYRFRMRTENGWDEQGRAAHQADEVALVPREPNRVSYDEREKRQWWRQVCSNRPQTGSDSVRTGYIAPGSPVPGATPGDKGKGAKGKSKGGKTQGKKVACRLRRGWRFKLKPVAVDLVASRLVVEPCGLDLLVELVNS